MKPRDIIANNETIQALVCPICQDFFQHPLIELHNGHTFCKACLERCPTRSCPICKVHSPAWAPDNKVTLLLNAIMVNCKLPGCNWKGPISKRKAHQETCDVFFQIEKNKLKGIVKQIKNDLVELSTHMTIWHHWLYMEVIRGWENLERTVKDWKQMWWRSVVHCERCKELCKKIESMESFKNREKERVEILKRMQVIVIN